MDIIYNGNSITTEVVIENIDRVTNLIFKLLPYREEGNDWITPLENLIVEIAGLADILQDARVFSVLCKLKGLLALGEEADFMLFRKNIFECLGLMNKVKNVIR